MNQMNKLETKDAVEILLSEKKKAGYKLEKAYDSYCLLPNEHDQEDWNNYSALVAALEMAVETLEKQIPKKLQNIHRFRGREKCVGACPVCGYVFCSDYGDYCGGCGHVIDWKDDNYDQD